MPVRRLRLLFATALLVVPPALTAAGASPETAARLAQAIDSPQRSAENRARDSWRHPRETLASAKTGYAPEAFVIDAARRAGFELADRSEVNANPRDTKDHPEGVWTLPPTYRLGEVDRAKYEAIGESDRMTLKFVKPAPAPAP